MQLTYPLASLFSLQNRYVDANVNGDFHFKHSFRGKALTSLQRKQPVGSSAAAFAQMTGLRPNQDVCSCIEAMLTEEIYEDSAPIGKMSYHE